MNTNYRITSDKPESVANIVMILLGPLIVSLSLITITYFYGVRYDGSYVSLVVITFLVSFIVFKEINLHTSWRNGGVSSQTREIVFAWLVFVSILLFLGYATKSSEEFSRRVILTWIIATPFVMLFSYAAAKILLAKILESEKYSKSVVIVGVNDLSKSLVKEISSDPQLNMCFKGYFDDRQTERLGKINVGGVLGKFDDLSQYVNKHKIDLIYFALPMVQEKRILNLLDTVRDTTASIYFVPDLFIFDLIQARIDDVNGIPVLAVCESPFAGVTGLLKRLSDLVFASILLILVSPIMLLIALSIKISMPDGKILFKQKRYGLDGEEIKVYKFRTMRETTKEELESGVVVQAMRNDDRITPLGSFLRRTSLDELPQFFNVLQGRMSVVGPRPHAVAHNEEYRKLIKGYMMRHKVRPGITGWAQVNGWRGETNTLEKMEKRVEYDLYYIENWSLWFDLKIIFLTLFRGFVHKNAY